jgi:hypothetical protein
MSRDRNRLVRNARMSDAEIAHTDEGNSMSDISSEVQRRAQAAVEVGPLDPIKALHAAGIRSRWAYIGGFASIGLSLAAWAASRLSPKGDRAQADRWGIFVGHWAPTFFAIGIALRHEEARQGDE